MKRVLMFALLIGLTVPRLGAAKHPTLDAKVDAAKCLECHADKTKGKSVHSAMASGCLSLPRSSSEQGHYSREVNHRHPSGPLPHLPRRQESLRDQRESPPPGGPRVPEMPRSAHGGKQEPVVEAGLGSHETGEPLLVLSQHGRGYPQGRQPARRRSTWVAIPATSLTRPATPRNANSPIT